jgi:hypothetical protein
MVVLSASEIDGGGGGQSVLWAYFKIRGTVARIHNGCGMLRLHKDMIFTDGCRHSPFGLMERGEKTARGGLHNIRIKFC